MEPQARTRTRTTTIHHHAQRSGRARPTTAAAAGRTERGAVLVEFAILLPLLALVVFASIDLGRLAQNHNRMENAAREGAGIAELHPSSVNSGCQGGRNIVDRTRAQNPGLAAQDGFTVTVARKRAGGTTFQPYTGCGTTSIGTISPGDRVKVTVTADVTATGILTATLFGSEMKLTRSMEVVVQG